MDIPYHAAEQFYQAAKDEYDHEAGRNANLDNKVSMTLAFCGVMFLFMIKYIGIRDVLKADEVISCYQCILRFCSALLQGGCLFCFAVSLMKLFQILIPKGYVRLDLNYMLKDNVQECEPNQAYMYIGKRYADITVYNRSVNEKRSKEYGRSIRWLLAALLFCVINEAITLNFL